MSIFGRTASCCTSDAWSGGSRVNLPEEFLTEEGRWARTLSCLARDDKKNDGSGIEMKIFKDYTDQNECGKDQDFKKLVRQSNISSVAIPVPVRVLSRQSSSNCATPKKENIYINQNDDLQGIDNTNNKEECNIQKDAVVTGKTFEDYSETFAGEPCFSPIMAPTEPPAESAPPGTKNSEKDQCERVPSTSESQNSYSQQQNQHNLSSGLRSTVSSGLGTIPSWSSSRPRDALRSTTSSGFSSWPRAESAINATKPCPLVIPASPYNLSRSKNQLQKNGFRSRSPPKATRSGNFQSSFSECYRGRSMSKSDPDLSNNPREFIEKCSQHNCHSNPSLKTCPDRCNIDGSNSHHPSISSVETCDASTSPHLAPEILWKPLDCSFAEHQDVTRPSVKNPVTASKSHEQSYQHDAFLAYSSCDSAWADKLIDILEAPPYGLHIYMYERDRILGRYTIPDIAKQIQASSKFICLLSPNFLRSAWCMNDLNMALQEQVSSRSAFGDFIVLLKISACEIPSSITHVEWEDCIGCTDGPNWYVVDKVVKAIRDGS